MVIRRFLLASVAALPLCGPAQALEEPRPCPGGDLRVRCIAPAPSQIILLRARPGASLVIDLPEGEKIIAVPVSDNMLMTRSKGDGAVSAVRLASEDDSSATVDGNLSVAVRGNAVVVKPHGPLAPQPFFVLTEQGGKQHRYVFELRAAAEDEASHYYSVRVRNVAAERAAQLAQATEHREKREKRVARDRLVQAQAAPCQGTSNRHYGAQGDSALAPSEICDDGRSTFLRFPGVQRMPMVTSVLPDGSEASVNVSTGADGWVTVHEHSPIMRLRDGGRVLCLFNYAYHPAGQNSNTGTVSSDVVRTGIAP